MPEHYEVKRVCRYLQHHRLESQRIHHLAFINGGDRMTRPQTPDFLYQSLINQPLLSIETKAKYTYLSFPSGTWVWHYRFTGIPHLRNTPYTTEIYTLFSLPIHSTNPNHVRLTIDFESDQLIYTDTRCLSTMCFFPGHTPHETPPYQRTADDLDQFIATSYDVFQSTVYRKRQSVKHWLLDQRVAPSGIGNYLACEILAHAQLHPFLPIGELLPNQYQSLCDGITRVCQLANQTPTYDWFLVFNRSNCGRCHRQIVTKKQPKNSQTTHFCSHCQPLENTHHLCDNRVNAS